MNESLGEIETQQQTPLDASLAQLVRAQLIVEKASVASWYDSTFDTTSSVIASGGIYARALAADLMAVQVQRPLHIQDDRKYYRRAPSPLTPDIRHTAIVRAHWHHASMVVHELAVVGRSPDVPLSLGNIYNLQACLDSIVAWFNVLFSMPARDIIFFSTIFSSQLRHCVGMLFYLTTLDDPGWDRKAVRARIDVLATVDRMRDDIRLSAEIAGWRADDGVDVFKLSLLHI